MRRSPGGFDAWEHVVAVLALAGCSVPEEQPLADGGPGGDGSTPAGVPDTTITEAPAELSNAASATFRFTSNLPDARFECSVDGHQFAEYSSPFTMTLGDGSHSFSVRAINRDGDGDDTPAEHLWSIDTVAPTTTLTERPPAADNSTMVTFSFTSNEINVPAVAIRGAYTKLSGVNDMDIITKSADLSISKGFAMFTPYAGYGMVWIESKEKSSLVTLKDESLTEGKGFIGCKLTFFPFMNLVVEADFAKVNSYSGRLNIHF